MNMQGLFQLWWSNEPARFWAALVVFLQAVIALFVGLDIIPLTGIQVALVGGVITAGAVLVGGESVRSHVTPVNPVPPEPEDEEQE